MNRALPLIVLLLAGCEVGPDYKPPQTTLPSTFSESNTRSSTNTATGVDDASLATWWTRIDDPELQGLIGRALASNLDLKSAVSRIREAREQAIIAGAKEWPELEANGTGLNLHSNSSPLASAFGGGGGHAPPSGPSNIKIYSAGFDATWELDVFGGIRRGAEQAEATAEAASWTMRDAQVSLTAEIANDYLALRTAQLRITILRDEIARQQNSFQLIAARRRAGLVTELDVDQQHTLLSNTAAQLPTLEAEARTTEHAIAVLAGQQPEAISKELESNPKFPEITANLEVGLPSDLLRRRPDIREAERKLAAATAGIGVAVADLYPKFNLLGSASFVSNHLTDLISGGNFSTIALGQISWPIFQGGQIRANIRAKKEETQQAYLAWQATVLKALQETEDALTRYANERQRQASLETSVQSARSSETIAEGQYRAGFVTFLNVLSAQSALLTAEDQLAQSRQAAAQDLVSLYKALGGGWSG